MLRVLRGQVQMAGVEEVLAVLRGSQGRHDVQMSLAGPAVDTVVAVVLEVILQPR